ncbi:MAG TPA: hypothetical protein DG761_04560, partial [Gammaproteobacteria bacterium]|nr:hypothetical protein [Gammaproteobacteria bacterium]
QGSPDPQRSAGQRTVWMPGTDHPAECPVIAREELRAANPVTGPAVITEDQTTLVVPAGWALDANPYGDLVATAGPAPSDTATAPAASRAIQRQVIWNRLISIVEEQA